MGSHGGFGQSKEFLDLVKSIGEARSKAKEDRIVLHEIETLKRRLVKPDIPKRKMKEYVIRLLYVEMLGHDASFGHIHAVKMTHDSALSLKRTGYSWVICTIMLRCLNSLKKWPTKEICLATKAIAYQALCGWYCT